MNRQYIGARYVPKFYEGSNGNNWEANHSYEALTIVTYLTNSYTSKIPVPANIGNPADNPTYWVLTGNYNGQVEEYRQAVEELKEYVELETNRRFVVLSDSYGLGRGSTTAWTTYLQTYLNASNDDYFTYSEGSMGFNRTGDGGHITQTLLQSKLSLITNPETISDVIVGMGANDVLATTGLKEAINDFVTYCKSVLPNAKISIGFIGNIADKNGSTLANFMSAYQQYISACGESGVTYITGVECIMHDATLIQSDGVHPTSNGSNEIAKFVTSFLRGESPIYSNYKRCTVTSTYFGNMVIEQYINGHTSFVKNLAGNSTAEITFPNRNSIQVGTIDDPIIAGVGGSSMILSPKTFEGEALNPILLTMFITNGEISISSNKTTSTTIESGIYVGSDNVSFPTMLI